MDLLDRKMLVKILEAVPLHRGAASAARIELNAPMERRDDFLIKLGAQRIIGKLVISAITEDGAYVNLLECRCHRVP
jgi:hypothetical protein